MHFFRSIFSKLFIIQKIQVFARKINFQSNHSLSVSLIEKIASRKGDSVIKVTQTAQKQLPEIDQNGLKEFFSSNSAPNHRHSIAIGELDNFDFNGELPRQSSILKINLKKPKRKKVNSTANPMKTANSGENFYTETRTNVSEKMAEKYSKQALAGLTAVEGNFYSS